MRTIGSHGDVSSHARPDFLSRNEQTNAPPAPRYHPGVTRHSPKPTRTALRFEHHHQPLLPLRVFIRRLLKFGVLAAAVILVALTIGTVGYHTIEGLNWVDSLLNASMILSGMGMVAELHTTAGKLFASAYALFSGVIFLTVAVILFTPLLHRLLHHFHLDEHSGENSRKPPSSK